MVEPEPGYEGEVCSYNLFALHLAVRRDVEPVGRVGVQGIAVLPDVGGVHPAGDPRQRPVEWFVQLSDEIQWDVEDRDTGAKRARRDLQGG